MKYEEHIDWGMKIVQPYGGGSIYNNFCLSSLTVVNLHGFINALQNTKFNLHEHTLNSASFH